MALDLAHPWLLTGIAVLAVLVLAFGLTEDAAVSRRVFQRFLINIALPLAVIGAPILLWAASSNMDARLLQAMVAGLIIAMGWLTTAIFGELEKARTKAERLRDYHKAIYAEIRDALATLYSDGEADAQAEALVARMKADDTFVPFVAREQHDRVYSALIEEIEVLPRQTIDAIVAYYSLIGSVASMNEDLRGARYADLPQERRALIYEDYISMRRRAYQYGLFCLELIAAYANDGAQGADAVAKRFNTQDAGHSGRSQGSE